MAADSRLVGVAMPVEDFEALIETLDVLADPVAMKAVQSARKGVTKYRLLDLGDENFGI